MVVAVTALVFVFVAPFIWRKGPDGTGTAFNVAVAFALTTIFFAIVSGLIGFGKEWRVDAIFGGIVLTMAFISLGIARAT